MKRRTSLQQLARQYFPKESRVLKVPDQRRFETGLLPILIVDFLRHLKPMHERQFIAVLDDILKRLYHEVTLTAEQWDRANLEDMVVTTLRRPQMSFRRSRVHVRHALRELRIAHDCIPKTHLILLSRGFLPFDGTVRKVADLDKRLAKLEAILASGVHPKHRTKREQKIATTKLHHAKKISKIQQAFAASVGNLLTRFARGKVKSIPINRIIQAVFEIGMGHTIPTATVNTIRVRVRKSQTQQ